MVNKLLHRTSEAQLPVYDNLRELTNRFANVFVDKISMIRSTLDSPPSIVLYSLSDFSPVSINEIESIIKKSNNKCCTLDPIPSWLLKACLPSLLPIITNIVNQSLTSIMPCSYKEAIFTPILKKPDLNTEDLKNYRPISNLSYVSKLIEKVVAKQITNYVSTNNLEEPMQSAYRESHSTETALQELQ